MDDVEFGYAVCGGCGVAVQRRRLATRHECGPELYARHQASRLHWKRNGFDDALQSWLATPAGRFAAYCARPDEA
jgi:hypothetical protein